MPTLGIYIVEYQKVVRVRPEKDRSLDLRHRPQLLIGDTLKMAREDLKANKTRNLVPQKLYCLISKIFSQGGKIFLDNLLISK